MKFIKDYFQELNDLENGIVYFVEKHSLRTRGIGSIRFKLLGFHAFVLIFFLVSSRVVENVFVLGADSKTRPFHPHVCCNYRD